MGIASQYVRALPVGTLVEVLLLSTLIVLVVGKIALHLIKRYL